EDRPPWTFSTYETRHDDGAEPAHVLFLPEEPPRQTYGTSRVIVNLSAPARDGRYETEAHQWVALYRRAGRDAARQSREHFLRPAGAPTRSPSLPPQETIVLRCPICVNTVAWTDDNLYEYVNSRDAPLHTPAHTDARR